MKFKLNYKQYSDFINITNNVFYPLKNFVNEQEFKSILRKQKIRNKFFPFPIFFGLKKKQFNEIKNEKKLTLIYKSTNIAEPPSTFQVEPQIPTTIFTAFGLPYEARDCTHR